MGTEAAADRDSSSSAGVRVDTTESFGVKQAEITVNYRFSQPDQALPVVLHRNRTARDG